MSQRFTAAIKEQIKREFIEGVLDEQGVRQYPSLDALAKTHNLARNTIYRNAKKEDWQGQKNKFQSRVDQRVTTNRVRDMAAEAKRLDDNALQIAQALIAQVGKKISDAIERERQGTFTGLSAAELRELSHVTGNAQKIGKLALGEAQEISKVSADVTAPESYIALVEELDRLAERKASLGKHTIQ